MANKTNFHANGHDYFRITKVIGKKTNEQGIIVNDRKQFLGKNKKDAVKKYEAYISKLNQGLIGEKQYFGILADKWLNTFFLPNTKLKDTTKERYIDAWDKYIRPSIIYSMCLDDISARTIQEIYNQPNATTSGIGAAHKLMRRYYKYLDQEGYARNITSALTLPSNNNMGKEHEITTWSDDDISIILNNFNVADPRFRFQFLIILAYYTGCRISELLALKYDDIQTDGIHIKKQVVRRPIIEVGQKKKYIMDLGALKTNQAYRTIPINPNVIIALKEHQLWQKKDMEENNYNTDFLFTTKNGKYYDRHNIQHACNRYYDRIGIERKGFHTYRHTFGTNLCHNGVPIQVASKLLGHADINVTAKYYINVPD